MARSDAGIDADHDLAAGVDRAVQVKLGKGIDADEEAVVHGVLHFVGGNVVADVQEQVGGEARQLVDVQLAGRHGVGVAALFADDAQEGGVGVGFRRVVDLKARKAGQAEQLPAAPAQHVLIVYVQWGAVLGGEFPRRGVSKEVDFVGLGGTNVWHGLSSEWQKITRQGNRLYRAVNRRGG